MKIKWRIRRVETARGCYIQIKRVRCGIERQRYSRATVYLVGLSEKQCVD